LIGDKHNILQKNIIIDKVVKYLKDIRCWNELS